MVKWNSEGGRNGLFYVNYTLSPRNTGTWMAQPYTTGSRRDFANRGRTRPVFVLSCSSVRLRPCKRKKKDSIRTTLRVCLKPHGLWIGRLWMSHAIRGFVPIWGWAEPPHDPNAVRRIANRSLSLMHWILANRLALAYQKLVRLASPESVLF